MTDKKTLHLTLKKKWFDMIASGKKKEEYRELKPYWINRLGGSNDDCVQYDRIIFRNGYSKNAPKIEVECLGIEIGTGLDMWGAETYRDYFVIKLGNIITNE